MNSNSSIQSMFRLSHLATLVLLFIGHSVRAATFVTNSPLQIARAYHTTTLLQNGKLLVAGGYNGSPIGFTEIYDPATGTAVTNGALSAARYQHTATLLPNGKVLVAGGLVAGNVPTNSAELYDPVSGTWTLTGPMKVARFYHTATLLTNGLVLVAGGEVTNGVPTNSTELFNPATGTWAITGPMVNGRYADTATLLADGTVLATGGLTPGITPTAELYNPATGAWALTGSMSSDRWGHVAAMLPNGQVLAAGGIFLGAIPSAEVYTPSTRTWSVTGSFNSLHVNDTATFLPNGSVMAVSGYYNPSADLTTNATEFYDPGTATWTYGPLVNTGRAFHTATLLPGGDVVLIGGYNGTAYLSSVETMELTNGYWQTINPMATGRDGLTLTLLTNGQALAAGGYGLSGGFPTNTEIYNPATFSWTSTAGGLHQGRAGDQATLLPNGKVLATGGYNNLGYLSTAEIFDPSTSVWTPTNSMNSVRVFHTATLLTNGEVLAAGGYSTSGIVGPSEIYNPATGTWTPTGSLHVPRYYHTATLLPNGQVLVAGGFNVNTLQSVETFNPVTDIWTTNNAMSIGRQGHSATLLPNGKVLVVGGSDVQTNHTIYLSSAELFDPSNGTWTVTGSLNFGRMNHTATLLPSGKVLVAGGATTNPVTSTEIYDPAIGSWTLTNALNTPRAFAAATLLPNGKVLVAGGIASEGVVVGLTSAELFYPIIFNAFWQPQVSALTATPARTLVGTGVQFRGISEGSGGNASQDSPADYPLLQLHSLANEQTRFVPITSWTTNSLTTTTLPNFPPGWAMATVFVNGIPSQSTLLDMTVPAAITFSNLTQYFDFTARPVSVSTVPPGLAVSLTYNGSAAAPTNVGSYAVAATVNDPIYSGTVTNTLQVEFLRNYGVDASHFQNSSGIPLANWQQMFSEGQRFAFVKSTEGLTGPDDPTMTNNVAAAAQAGLLVGVYHFAHPENRPTTNGAVQEADHMLGYTGSAIGPGMLRPVLDIETGLGTLTPSQMSDWVLAFSQEIVNHRGAGAAPIVYCLQSYANSAFDTRLAGNALWLQAANGGDPTFTDPPANGFASATGIFTNWAFWQYNITGSAGGINPIDLDVSHDDVYPLASYLMPTPAAHFSIQGTTLNSSGFNLSFTNVPGTHFSLLSTTNLVTPLSNWTLVKGFTEISPGEFQVVDGSATNVPTQYYRVTSP
jgi:GH25 family lysozyme M1 (1,4-beta-N-acetylmuramidase)/N-acetylneuraminic acid mutarotase